MKTVRIRQIPTACSTALLLSYVFFPFPASADEPCVSLGDAMARTVKINRDIAAARAAADVAGYTLAGEEAAFLPRLKAVAAVDREVEDDGATPTSKSTATELDVAVEKPNRLGGVLSVGVSGTSGTFDQAFPFPAETNRSTASLGLTYKHPLLRGGALPTNLAIRKAEIDSELREMEVGIQREQVLLDVLRGYFALYSAQETVRLQESIREKMEQVEAIVREKVKMRRLPVSDLNKVAASLVLQDQRLLGLRRNVDRRRGELFLAIHAEEVAVRSTSHDMPVEDGPIVLTTTPEALLKGRRVPDAEQVRLSALAHDPELARLEATVRVIGQDTLKARDDLRPDLHLSVGGGLAGYSAGDLGDALGDVSSGGYSIGASATLSWPVLNTAARMRLRALMEEQRVLTHRIRKRRGQVTHAVRQLVADLQTARAEIALAQKGVALARQNVDDETSRLVAEKSTVLDILYYQTELTDAELGLLSVKVACAGLEGQMLYYGHGLATLASGRSPVAVGTEEER